MKLIGRGVDVLDEKTVILDVGSEKGVTDGQRFLLFGGDRRIKGLNGEDLGVLEVTKGYGSVSHVQEHLCVVKSVDPVTAALRGISGPGFTAVLNNPLEAALTNSLMPTGKYSSYEKVIRGDYARPV